MNGIYGDHSILRKGEDFVAPELSGDCLPEKTC